MEIQVGEYIRTKDGYIRKIIEDFSTDNSYFKLDKEKLAKYDFTYFYSDEIFKKEIKNHSFNIIDLIEEGDYVNGDKIVKIEEDIYIGGLNLWTERDVPDGFGGFYRVKYREKDIKFVVTHEQMEAMEYEVK